MEQSISKVEENTAWWNDLWTAASWSESQFSVPGHKLCATCFSINTIVGTWTLCPFSWGAGRRKCYNHRYLLGDWLCSLSSQITTVPGVTQHTFISSTQPGRNGLNIHGSCWGKIEVHPFIHSFIHSAYHYFSDPSKHHGNNTEWRVKTASLQFAERLILGSSSRDICCVVLFKIALSHGCRHRTGIFLHFLY